MAQKNGTFKGQGQKIEIKGRCWNGSNLGAFLDAEGQDALQPGTQLIILTL